MDTIANGRRLESVLVLAWPTVVTYFAFAARQFTDTWMVGQLGEEFLAALMPAQQVLYVLLGFAVGLMTALNTCGSHAARRFGPESCSAYAWQAIFIALLVGALGASLHFVAESIFRPLNHDYPVYLSEVTYFEISVWAFPAQVLAAALANFFFAARLPLLPMWGGIVHVVLNIILNYILMFGVPGLVAPMGIAGAAWGTVVASVVWAVLLLGMFFFHPALRVYRTWIPRISFRKGWDLLKIGLPNGFIDVADTLFWNVALIFFIGGFGTEHLAAAAIVYSVLMLISVPGDGVGVALTTLIGHHLAAGDEKEANRDLRSTLLLNLVFMGGAGVLCWHFGTEIFASFTNSGEAIGIGVKCMVLLPVILAFDACLYAVDNALNGAGDAAWTLKATFLANSLVILAGGWLMSHYFPDLGSYGIWLVIAANRAVVALVLALRWKSGGWRFNNPVTEE